LHDALTPQRQAFTKVKVNEDACKGDTPILSIFCLFLSNCRNRRTFFPFGATLDLKRQLSVHV